MKRNIIAAFVLTLATLPALGQQREAEEFLQMPDWMQSVMDNSEGVDYAAFVKRFNDFRNTLPNNGKKTPFNKPVLNAFKWWQKYYGPYVMSNGKIHVPDNDEEKAFILKENARVKKLNTSSAISKEPGDDHWKVIAPFETFDFKRKTKVPWQSNIQRLDVSNSNPDIIYAGTETGMIFKSVDKGLNWQPCARDMFFGGEITSVEVALNDPDKVLVGAVHNLWLTTDGGVHWKNITPSVPTIGVRVRDAVFYGNNDARIIAGTDKAVYVSDNNGQSWRKIMEGRCFDIKVQTKAESPKIYALVSDLYPSREVNLYTSDDQGRSFTKKQISTPDIPIASGRLCTNLHHPEYLYALICSSKINGMPFFQGKPYLLKSKDEGETFVYQDISSQVNAMDARGGQGYYDMIIASLPDKPEHLFFGLLFLYSSQDGGKTIDLHEQIYPERNGQKVPNIGGYFGKYDLHTDMQDIDVDARGNLWLATDGGINYSADYLATEPTVRMKGIYASEFWGFDQGWNEDVIVGGRNHNGDMVQKMETYEGHSMAMRGSEHPTGYVFLSNPRKVTFSDTQQRFLIPDKWDGVFKDFEGAEQFHIWPLESYLYGFRFVHDPRYAKCFYIVTNSYFGKRDATDRMLWRTTDDGLSYTLVKEFDRPVTSYAVSRTNPEKIVVALEGRLVYSTDAGATWQDFPVDEQIRDYPKYRVYIDPKDENTIWVTNYQPGGLFKTTNNGQSWKNMGQGLLLNAIDEAQKKYMIVDLIMTGNEKEAVYALAYNEFDYDSHVKRYQAKILYRDNTIQQWVEYTKGMQALMRINRLVPFYKEGKLRIATDNGVWERNLVDTQFTPVVQPMILNVGGPDEKNVTELHFDSYSIVNQNGAKWEWKFNPQPISINDAHRRDPIVVIDSKQSYDVTLSVTVPVNGEEKTVSKTVKRIIAREKPVPDTPTGINKPVQTKEVNVFPSLLHNGEPLHVQVEGITTPVTFSLYDLNGKIVWQTTVENGESLLLPERPKGVSIYSLKAVNYEKIGKILIR